MLYINKYKSLAEVIDFLLGIQYNDKNEYLHKYCIESRAFNQKKSREMFVGIGLDKTRDGNNYLNGS